MDFAADTQEQPLNRQARRAHASDQRRRRDGKQTISAPSPFRGTSSSPQRQSAPVQRGRKQASGHRGSGDGDDDPDANQAPQGFAFSKPLYTITELLTFLGSRATIYKLIGAGELEIIKVGRRTFVLTDSIAALIQRRRRAA